MGPVRASSTRRQESSQINQAGPSKPRARRIRPEQDTGVPGVQKIKSALRQTRRLLAKDNLAADVRVETERRQKALEADLQLAQASKKERSFALRYHKIKFFERQKVARKLNQVKKQLESADASSEPQLESTLFNLRVDLNYVLHYPKTKKYISLFPPDLRQGKANTIPSGESAKTDVGRKEVHDWIRSRMESGELWSEPELHLEARRSSVKRSTLRTEPWAEKAVEPKLSEQPTSHGDPDMSDDFFDEDSDDSE